jgi:hypothetical protein
MQAQHDLANRASSVIDKYDLSNKRWIDLELCSLLLAAYYNL